MNAHKYPPDGKIFRWTKFVPILYVLIAQCV